MGMFDRLVVLGASRFVCGAGHPQREFQSKDLQDHPAMNEYFLFEGRLYLSATTERANSGAALRNGALVLTWEQAAAPVELSAAVSVYTHCQTCDPVYFERPTSLSWDAIDQRAPWVEYELGFERGVLVAASARSVDTREELKSRMLKDGVHVLPDDDRIVRRVRELKSTR